MASALTVCCGKEYGPYVRVVFALPTPVPPEAFAPWLADVFVAASASEPLLCGWWNLLWHCDDEKLCVTFGAWFDAVDPLLEAECAVTPAIAAALRAAPFPAALPKPTLVFVSACSHADMKALETRATAHEDDALRSVSCSLGWVQRRVNVSRFRVVYALGGQCTNNAFLVRAVVSPRTPDVETAFLSWLKAAFGKLDEQQWDVDAVPYAHGVAALVRVAAQQVALSSEFIFLDTKRECVRMDEVLAALH